MANRSREIQLKKFREDPGTKVMITSIKTAGLGLDFSVANKCILEAVQEQVSARMRIKAGLESSSSNWERIGILSTLASRTKARC